MGALKQSESEMASTQYDYDWLIIGSGFGGSVSALRLAEKGYRVGVLECGHRFGDKDFAASTWQLGRFLWAPLLGLKGILRLTPFKDVLVANGSGVGGGSLVYANTLYRAKPEFFAHALWRDMADWNAALQPHYDTAERMLGVNNVPFDSTHQQLLRRMARHYGTEDSFRPARPCPIRISAERVRRAPAASAAARAASAAAWAPRTRWSRITCGSLPRISDRLGELVRTNSESILTVRLPEDLGIWNDVAISGSIHVDADTHIELVTLGRKADFMSLLYTCLVGDGTRLARPLTWIGSLLRHPLRTVKTLWPVGWSRRTTMFLVMQALDNAIALRAKKRWFNRGYSLSTEQDGFKPNPTFIAAGNAAAAWLAARTGGIAQSNIFEAAANIPTTAHLLGGAVIGADAGRGVIDHQLRVFGYQNLLVCDGAAMPANPGVNPSLTITALAEHAMARIPPAAA